MAADRFDELVQAFMRERRMAIWGLEATKGDPGEWVASRFRRQGVEVVGVNPGYADDPSLLRASSLTRISPPVRAVLVYVDRPQAAAAVDDCIAARTPLVWLHDALSAGAAVPALIERLKAAGCAVIPGLCPMMYLGSVDPAHACLRWVLRLTGKEKRVRQGAG